MKILLFSFNIIQVIPISTTAFYDSIFQKQKKLQDVIIYPYNMFSFFSSIISKLIYLVVQYKVQ